MTMGISDNAAADGLFALVGTHGSSQTKAVVKGTWKQRLKGKPVISLCILTLIILGCLLAPMLANHDPAKFYLISKNQKPNGEFFFGTDSLGRDLYSMIWYGGRVSLAIGFLSAAIITLIGVTYGCISGTASDKVDSVMMRATELLGSVPSLLLVLVLAAIMPTANVFSISLIIGITSWFGLARIVRSEVRQIRNSEYVLYARSSAVSSSM